MPRMEFEPTIPVFDRARTFHALDHAAIMVDIESIQIINMLQIIIFFTIFFFRKNLSFKWRFCVRRICLIYPQEFPCLAYNEYSKRHV
jgi:hypothetical protein